MTKQRIDIIGRIGKDPETRAIQTGKNVTSFSLAVTEKYGDKETTTWFNCIAWDKAGEIIAKYTKKGDLLNVEGKIQTRDYKDKDGVTKYVWEVVVREFTLLGSRSSTGSEQSTSNGQVAGSNPAASANPFGGYEDMNDEIPF